MTKWQTSGRVIIELLKKEPLFVCGLSVFLSFQVLQKFRPPARMFFFWQDFLGRTPYHYAHSSGTSLVGNKKNLPQLIHAIFSKQQLAISGVKLLPKDVDRLVAILYNDGH
jgi:hypothetical protein